MGLVRQHFSRGEHKKWLVHNQSRRSSILFILLNWVVIQANFMISTEWSLTFYTTQHLNPCCFSVAINYILIQAQVIFRSFYTRIGNACPQPVINWAPVVGGGSRSVFDSLEDLATVHPPPPLLLTLVSPVFRPHLADNCPYSYGFYVYVFVFIIESSSQTLHNFRFSPPAASL